MKSQISQFLVTRGAELITDLPSIRKFFQQFECSLIDVEDPLSLGFEYIRSMSALGKARRKLT